jgi:hypothetical protein
LSRFRRDPARITECDWARQGKEDWLYTCADRVFLYTSRSPQIFQTKTPPRPRDEGRSPSRSGGSNRHVPAARSASPASTECRYRSTSTRPVLWSRADGPRVIFLLSRGRVRGGGGETRRFWPRFVRGRRVLRASCYGTETRTNGPARRGRGVWIGLVCHVGCRAGGGTRTARGGSYHGGTERNRSARKEQLAGARHRGGHGGGAEQSRQIQRRHHPLARPRRAKE